MCRKCPALAAWAEPGALLAFLHGPGDGERKNRILRDLVAIAQAGDTPHQAAQVTLLLALWPGLDAIFRRQISRFRRDPSALASDLLAHVSEGVLSLRPDRVQWVAATLLRNAERDLGRAEIAMRKRRGMTCELTDAAILPPVGSGRRRGAMPIDDATGQHDLRQLLAGLTPEEAAMVIAVVILGETQREAALRFGISHDAARKRYQRAMERLRTELNGRNG